MHFIPYFREIQTVCCLCDVLGFALEFDVSSHQSFSGCPPHLSPYVDFVTLNIISN